MNDTPTPKKKRIASTVKGPATPEDFHRSIDETTALQLELETATAALNELLNQTGTELRQRIETLTKEVKARLDGLYGYAHPRRDQIFAPGHKTAETTRATYGLAQNPARFSIAPEMTEDDVIAALVRIQRVQFVRTVASIDKDGIKAALRVAAEMEAKPAAERPANWEPEITMAELRMCGLRLSQTERFWLEPKRSATPPDSTLTA